MRAQLEEAIVKLQSLLEEESLHEERFQEYFEKHTIVFESLGYIAQYPKIHLESGDSSMYPDFILENQTSLFEIWDVKLPYEKIIKSKKYRDELYSKVSSEYAGQLREYSDFFDDSFNREMILKQYGINVQKKPKKYLIIGRNENLDRQRLHEIQTSRGHDIEIFTYDDILIVLKKRLLSASIPEQRLFGTSLLILLGIVKNDALKNRYIIDLGFEQRPERFSMHLDNNRSIYFTIIGSNGIKYELESKLPGDENYFYLHCSIGCSDDISFLEFFINGNIVGSLEVPQRVFNARGFNYRKRFMNCDMNKSNFGYISPELTKVYNCQLDLKTRIREDECFFNRLNWLLSQPKIPTVTLENDTFVEYNIQKEGESSILDKNIVSLWDLNDFPFKGVHFRQIREQGGFDYSSLPPNKIELTNLQRKGRITFKIGKSKLDWASDNKEYSFKPLQVKGIYIHLIKQIDCNLIIHIEGLLGLSNTLTYNIGSIKSNILFIDIAWEDNKTKITIEPIFGENIPDL